MFSVLVLHARKVFLLRFNPSRLTALRSPHFKSCLMGSLVAAACLAQAQSGGNDEWVQFPPRPGPSAPKVQNDQPKAARSTPPVTASTDDGWIKFPPLPPPKPASAAKTEELAPAPVQATKPPPPAATPTPAPEPAAATAAPASKPPASSEFVFKAFKFDLTEGEVLITITEGKFAGAKLETPNSPKLPTDYLVKLVETAQPKGEAVRMGQLDRATLLLGEVPGVQANMRLRSGEKEGETEALLQVAEGKAWDGQVSWDNAGPVSTGFNRMSTQLNRYGALGRADISSMQYMRSDGTDYLRLAYSEPFGYWGSRWGTNISVSRYKVVTSDYLTLNPHGPANSVGFDLTLPLLRSRTSSASMQVALDRKFFRNNTNAGVISDYFMDTVTTSLQGSRNDEWWGGGETSVGAQVTRGLVDLSGSPNEESDASSSMTAGRFTKLRLNLNRQQTLTPTTQLVGSYQMQVASKNLDGSEKFSLAGVQAVRAYPSSEANGNAAQLLTVEYQKTLQLQQYPFKLSVFLDAGRITKLKFNTGSGINTYNLQGAGLWLGSSLPNRWGQAQWRMTWAHRIGTNPAAQANGTDLDGTLHNDRFWLSVIQQF
jgi:hemolysin activation/secretion protein